MLLYGRLQYKRILENYGSCNSSIFTLLKEPLKFAPYFILSILLNRIAVGHMDRPDLSDATKGMYLAWLLE